MYTPGYGREPLRRDVEQNRNNNPWNHIPANRHSYMGSPTSATVLNPTFFSTPTRTTTYYPSSNYSHSWTFGVGLSSTSLKVLGIALVVLGAFFTLVGAAALAPELLALGITKMIVGGVLIAIDLASNNN